MKISAKHLPRYRQIARLLWKYGRSDLVTQMNMGEPFEPSEAPPARNGEPTPDELAADLEAMGPTFVKLGQVLSSRPDILPPAYLEALSRLQDKVQPFSYEEVEAIVEGELGARISKAFSRFDTTPLAAASLGQVHAAALRDGHEVVVKVQRPGITEQVTEDFEVLTQIGEFLEAHTEVGRRHRILDMLEQFRLTINHELNYEREARNLQAMGKNLAEFEKIMVPQPVPDFCTRRVLTMDYVSGSKITKVSPIARLDMDGSELADELFRAYLKQVLVDGLFHADPHPGNVFLTDDYRIALLDLGMVGHTTPGMQQSLLKVLLAVSEGKSEEACRTLEEMSEIGPDFDRAGFHKRIAQVIADQRNMELQNINVGTTLLQVTRIGSQQGLYVPSELTVLGKTLLQLDQVGKILDPEFDPNAAVRRNAAKIMSQRVNRDATQGSILSSLLEMKDFVGGLPGRVNKVLDAVGNREIEVKVRTPDVDVFLTGMEKVANRITTGIVLAALIIGASLLMRVETDYRVFGYPGLAMLLFLAAAIQGFWLVITILMHDRRVGKRGVGRD